MVTVTDTVTAMERNSRPHRLSGALLAAALLLGAAPAAAQDLGAESRAGRVDVFMGLDFHYRDIHFNNRVFDVLANLTPGVRWNMGRRWEATAQVILPVVNQYGDAYKRVRLGMATLSKQLLIARCWKLKATAGLFGTDRYGLDLKNQVVITPWLAFTAQAGFTGYWSMATSSWQNSKMDRFTFQVGPDLYLRPWNTEVTVRGGRWVYGDNGVVGEVYRHFNHVSVGVFGAYSNKGNKDAGFKVVVMLPPYKRPQRKVCLRPASNFRLTYTVEADSYSTRTYFTDPEENERSGWFDHDLKTWGSEQMEE